MVALPAYRYLAEAGASDAANDTAPDLALLEKATVLEND